MIFSGVQPSGTSLHLGNYLGAVRRWVELQYTEKCLFCVVDLHALTSLKTEEPSLHSKSLSLLANYIACGLDPEKAVLFLQSDIPEHTELCWVLGCITPVGWLNRMTQFKDKSKHVSSATMGLYSYPVLMAADIMLYKADKIPVGSDQKQHIELSQSIVQRFNSIYGVNYFCMPSALPFDKSARIMSLRDAKKKMSKSDSSDFSRINLDDEDAVIVKKIRKAKTDCLTGFAFQELSQRPELENLVNIFSALYGENPEAVCLKFKDSNTSEFKDVLIDLLIKEISPIRARIRELIADTGYIAKILTEGKLQARELAHTNMREIRQIIGLA